MQEGGTYTGIQGLVAQDQAVTESMGAVVDRSREHLAPSDRMITRPGAGCSSAARALREHGTVPPGVDRPEVFRNARVRRVPRARGARTGTRRILSISKRSSARCGRRAQRSRAMRRRTFLSTAPARLVVGAMLAVGTAPARAAWPERPVRIVVPYAPGGPVDLVARLIGDKLATKFGQSFVIENKPGANGAIGVQALMAAPADGYTLLMHGSAGVTIYPAVMKQPGLRHVARPHADHAGRLLRPHPSPIPRCR